MMPPLGAPLRTEQLATLERITHERFTSERTGELLAAAEAGAGSGCQRTRSMRASSLRRKRLYEKERRVPVELAVAQTQGRPPTATRPGWRRVRRMTSRRSRLRCERNIELTREYIACFDGYDDPYDVVLDDFAPGMLTAQVSRAVR